MVFKLAINGISKCQGWALCFQSYSTIFWSVYHMRHDMAVYQHDVIFVFNSTLNSKNWLNGFLICFDQQISKHQPFDSQLSIIRQYVEMPFYVNCLYPNWNFEIFIAETNQFKWFLHHQNQWHVQQAQIEVRTELSRGNQVQWRRQSYIVCPSWSTKIFDDQLKMLLFPIEFFP